METKKGEGVVSAWLNDTKTVLIGLVIQAIVVAVGYGTLQEKVRRNVVNIKDNSSRIEERVNRDQDMRERMIRVETLLENISFQVSSLQETMSDSRERKLDSISEHYNFGPRGITEKKGRRESSDGKAKTESLDSPRDTRNRH